MNASRGIAWVGDVLGANNAHSIAECSNKGVCDRNHGVCICDSGFSGLSCEYTTCPSECSNNGQCMSQRMMASQNNRVYATPWDSSKQYGCVCDLGYRGIACNQGIIICKLFIDISIYVYVLQLLKVVVISYL